MTWKLVWYTSLHGSSTIFVNKTNRQTGWDNPESREMPSIAGRRCNYSRVIAESLRYYCISRLHERRQSAMPCALWSIDSVTLRESQELHCSVIMATFWVIKVPWLFLPAACRRCSVVPIQIVAICEAKYPRKYYYVAHLGSWALEAHGRSRCQLLLAVISSESGARWTASFTTLLPIHYCSSDEKVTMRSYALWNIRPDSVISIWPCVL